MIKERKEREEFISEARKKRLARNARLARAALLRKVYLDASRTKQSAKYALLDASRNKRLARAALLRQIFLDGLRKKRLTRAALLRQIFLDGQQKKIRKNEDKKKQLKITMFF